MQTIDALPDLAPESTSSWGGSGSNPSTAVQEGAGQGGLGQGRRRAGEAPGSKLGRPMRASSTEAALADQSQATVREAGWSLSQGAAGPWAYAMAGPRESAGSGLGGEGRGGAAAADDAGGRLAAAFGSALRGPQVEVAEQAMREAAQAHVAALEAEIAVREARLVQHCWMHDHLLLQVSWEGLGLPPVGLTPPLAAHR